MLWMKSRPRTQDVLCKVCHVLASEVLHIYYLGKLASEMTQLSDLMIQYSS